MKQFTPTCTSCLWPSHLKVGRDRSGGRFLIFLKRILLADQVNALPIRRIKLNKNKSIGRTKVQVQSFHTSLSVNSSGQRNFNREPRLGFFLIVFHPAGNPLCKDKNARCIRQALHNRKHRSRPRLGSFYVHSGHFIFDKKYQGNLMAGGGERRESPFNKWFWSN